MTATRPIPQGRIDNLALSADGRYLYAAYRTAGANPSGETIPGQDSSGNGGVFIYDVAEMIKLINAIESDTNAMQLEILRKRPINNIQVDPSGNPDPGTGTFLSPVGQRENPFIDVHADYRVFARPIVDASGVVQSDNYGNWYGKYTFGVPAGQVVLDPTFNVQGQLVFERLETLPTGNGRAPIGTGGSPRGIAVQQEFLELNTPTNGAEVDGNPTFKWTVHGPHDIEDVRIYVTLTRLGRAISDGYAG